MYNASAGLQGKTDPAGLPAGANYGCSRPSGTIMLHQRVRMRRRFCRKAPAHNDDAHVPISAAISRLPVRKQCCTFAQRELPGRIARQPAAHPGNRETGVNKALPSRHGARRERLIVVEDDPVTRTMVAGYFADHGFEVEEAGTAAECRQILKRRNTDLIFIDVQLPDCDGFDLAKEVQGVSNAGIIFVTRRTADVDRIVGLEIAGDHYVTKPIDLRDLLARARSLLRRRAIDRAAARRGTSISFGNWILDLVRRELSSVDGTALRLTRAEFDLLAALVDADGRPLNREYLIEVVSNRQAEVDARTVDTLVARLRRKLVGGGSQPVIATVSGIGYKLALPVEERR
jgi:two-component system torCAD operon response regulator TorR